MSSKTTWDEYKSKARSCREIRGSCLKDRLLLPCFVYDFIGEQRISEEFLWVLRPFLCRSLLQQSQTKQSDVEVTGEIDRVHWSLREEKEEALLIYRDLTPSNRIPSSSSAMKGTAAANGGKVAWKTALKGFVLFIDMQERLLPPFEILNKTNKYVSQQQFWWISISPPYCCHATF